MFSIGRICVKLAGRDAGRKCVIIDVLDEKFVLIDGDTRRRKCNIVHLEPLEEVIKIDKNASHDKVKTAFKKLGIELKDRKKKAPKEKPKKVRKHVARKEAAKTEAPKKKESKPKKEAKKEVKKESKAEKPKKKEGKQAAKKVKKDAKPSKKPK